MTAPAANPYRSRTNQAETIVPRQDPVRHTTAPASTSIDEALAKQFADDGYFVLEDLFDADEIDCFQREAERLRNDALLARRQEAIVEPGNQQIRSVFNVPQFSPIFQKLIHDARLVGWARYLLNDDVYIHQSRLNYKPGFAGKPFHWHSDFETWHVEDGMPRMRALSFSIALTDNFASNGPVMVIPGSHKQYVSCSGLTPENNYTKSLRKQEYGVPSNRALEQLAQDHPIEVITCRAGSVLAFDCNTMHGSSGNMTPYARTNLFFVYNAMCNRLVDPPSGQQPRPEFVARRRNIQVVEPIGYHAGDFLSSTERSPSTHRSQP